LLFLLFCAPSVDASSALGDIDPPDSSVNSCVKKTRFLIEIIGGDKKTNKSNNYHPANSVNYHPEFNIITPPINQAANQWYGFYGGYPNPFEEVGQIATPQSMPNPVFTKKGGWGFCQMATLIFSAITTAYTVYSVFYLSEPVSSFSFFSYLLFQSSDASPISTSSPHINLSPNINLFQGDQGVAAPQASPPLPEGQIVREREEAIFSDRSRSSILGSLGEESPANLFEQGRGVDCTRSMNRIDGNQYELNIKCKVGGSLGVTEYKKLHCAYLLEMIEEISRNELGLIERLSEQCPGYERPS